MSSKPKLLKDLLQKQYRLWIYIHKTFSDFQKRKYVLLSQKTTF